MKRWATFIAVLAMAGGIAVGLNAVLGESSPQQPAPTPSPFVPPNDPCRGPFEIGEPQPTDIDCPELEALGEDSSYPGITGGGTSLITDRITIGGKEVRLPPGTDLQTGTEQPHPCAPDQSPLEVAIAAVTRPGEKVSWVKFTLKGTLQDSHIQPEHEKELQELLQALEPRWQPPEYCVTIKGEVVALPDGATLSTPLVEPGPGYSGPTSFLVVHMGNSWLSFTSDGVLLESRVHAEDEAPLKPILEKLSPR